MKTTSFGILLILILLSVPAASAALRDDFASSPEAVTPLLEGMQIPDATFRTPDGDPVSLRALALEGPSVLLFYRGGWCPYCNRQLSALKNIEAQLTGLGYQILAVSPQSPKELKNQSLQTDFAAKLFTDTSLQALKDFGIGFYVDAQTQSRYQQHGIALTQTDAGKAVLPAPAVFIIDSQGQIQFSYVNPDYRARPSAEMVLAVARALVNEHTAD